MRVLFVFRGYEHGIRNPIVSNQLESLLKTGIEVDFFPISKGGLHYFKSFFHLNKYLKKNKYDLVHAHYGYTAILAALANPGKTVASLMGSDIHRQHGIIRFIIKLFSENVWDKTIVKSIKMKTAINNSIIIPNGVNLSLFKQNGKEESSLKVGFNKKYNIIFIAVHPYEKVKNLYLAQQAIQLLENENIQFHIISNADNKEMPCYYSAADLVLLTSFSEGSPNVIKEAMACNCPIVSTDVGDVREVFGKTEGCFITGLDPSEVADKIKKALEFANVRGRTQGRQRIVELGLDSDNIAQRIVEVYKEVLNS